MILDKLTNSEKYCSLHPNFNKAFAFLQREDLASLKEGTYEIDGKDVFAIVAKDQGRQKDEAELEIHDQYIDIQLVLSGIDEMGWKARSACNEITKPFESEGDIQFFADTPTAWVATPPEHFAIFFPTDAHLPLIAAGILHKVVVKIAVS